MIDADALNALAGEPAWRERIGIPTVLTPHPGEMARLSRMTVEDVQDDRLNVAVSAAAEWQQIVVLKGAHTVVAAPDGRAAISPYANPLLATAGTGDVLAGAIAGLLAQGLAPFDAAACGVYLHALAAEELGEDLGDRGLLASDLLPALPRRSAPSCTGGRCVRPSGCRGCPTRVDSAGAWARWRSSGRTALSGSRSGAGSALYFFHRRDLRSNAKMEHLIYLDHAATTPLHPSVLDAMLPYLTTSYGNPSATYGLARAATEAVQSSRHTVAELLGCRPTEIVFTGGGTESINTAIKGVAFQQKKARAGDHIVTSTDRASRSAARLPVPGALRVRGDVRARRPVRHRRPARRRARGHRAHRARQHHDGEQRGRHDGAGRGDRDGVRERARMLKKRIPFHTDAVQAPNSLRLDEFAREVDLLSLAAHKFRGPKGMGVLYIRRGVPFLAQQNGGGQERQRRAGTENVAGIVGTAEALRLTQGSLELTATHTRVGDPAA